MGFFEIGGKVLKLMKAKKKLSGLESWQRLYVLASRTFQNGGTAATGAELQAESLWPANFASSTSPRLPSLSVRRLEPGHHDGIPSATGHRPARCCIAYLLLSTPSDPGAGGRTQNPVCRETCWKVLKFMKAKKENRGSQ